MSPQNAPVLSSSQIISTGLYVKYQAYIYISPSWDGSRCGLNQGTVSRIEL